VELAGGWRRLHNEKLRNLHTSLNIITVITPSMKWAGHVARMGEIRKSYKALSGKPEGKISLGRTRRRWKHNIRMDVKEIG